MLKNKLSKSMMIKRKSCLTQLKQHATDNFHIEQITYLFQEIIYVRKSFVIDD
jgi:hypothetical protein